MKKIYILEVRVHGDLMLYLANNHFYTSLKKAKEEQKELEKVPDYDDVYIRTLTNSDLVEDHDTLFNKPLLQKQVNDLLYNLETNTNETTTEPTSHNRK